jgi:protocatechuate 3,4-dioxygenase beta subunit
MAKSNRRFFGWCPAPEPNSFRSLRQYNRPLLALITMATLICSVAAASYIAFSSTAAVAAPLVNQPQIPNQTPAPENNTSETSEETPTSSSSTSSSSTSSQPSSGSQTSTTTATYLISGYVLNSSGNGVANANVTFNAQIALTDSSGYYQINVASGTYTITVSPPSGFHYVTYSQTGFVVNSDTIKNITLTTICYVSGYITDSTGAPINGAVISFENTIMNNSYNGGYYSMYVPSGTYTLTVTPAAGDNYYVYVENNLVINANVVKNITLTSIP